MHRLLHLARRQKNIGSAIIGYQKTKSIAVPGDPSSHEIELARQQQNAFAIRQELAISLHRCQAFAEYFERDFGDGKPISQLLRSQWGICLAQAGEDCFASRN